MRREPSSHFVEPIQEDAQIDSASESRMRLLEQDMAGIEWDIILLETGHANVQGKNKSNMFQLHSQCVLRG